MVGRQDEKGRTHIDWELEGVTPQMIDWWWVNMEKGFPLWHPIEHKEFHWEVPPKPGKALGAIHYAPQELGGRLVYPHIRWDDVATLPEDMVDICVYDHVLLAAVINYPETPGWEGQITQYRIHQYEATDFGTRGRSTAIAFVEKERKVEGTAGLTWAQHGSEEIMYFGQFLPELWKLWRAVKDPAINLQFSFKVKKEGKTLRYVG